MAKVFIEETTLTAIGDAIRSKTGRTDLIDPALMSAEIEAIEAGGGDIPPEALILSGSCKYRFANGGWDWFVNKYGDKMTTASITDAGYMFQSSSLETIPFQINLSNCSSLTYLLFSVEQLKTCPKIRGTIKWGTSTDFSSMLSSTRRIRDLEDLFTSDMLEGFSTVKVTSAYSTPKVPNFSSNWSLRRIPSWWYKFRLNEESTAFPSYTYCLYSGMLQSAQVLDEATSIPVWKCQGAQTSNMFSNTFRDCSRLKRATFETTEDGSPIVTQWKAQVIDLTSNVGYTSSTGYITDYNSGITSDKQVKDDATYQALKDDPDWFTVSSNYSRYNHDSAVETINSLPDTSAYLASAGGTNTIKFKGESGSKTDGGAIENLTEEEIAIAAAKGWTVTLV